MTVAVETRTRRSSTDVAAVFDRAGRLGMPLILIAGLLLYGAVFIDGFLTVNNAVQIVRSQSFVGIAAIGMTFVVISGNFVDLSVPATIAVSANVVLTLDDRSVVAAVAVALALGLAVGLLNGVVVSALRVNSVITTLGVGSILAGLLLWRTGGALSRGAGGGLTDFATARPLGVPSTVWVFLGLLLIAQMVLVGTRFGAQLRATGGNPRAARISGVPTVRITIAAFVLAGFLAAVTGVLLGGFANQADIAVGKGYEFDALIAVVIGGTALTGGTGGFGRTLLGLSLLGLVNNVLLLEGHGTSVQLLSRGALFLAVVIGNAVLDRRLGRA
jgi:ribose transport system permease protein